VDDTDEVRTLIRRALAAHGYQVDVAASLAQASALDPGGYDVVLVDADLGTERGTDLIDALLAQDPGAAARCLMITGGGTGLAPAGVACLPKPFRPADLLAAVRARLAPGPAPAAGAAPGDTAPAPVLAAAVPAAPAAMTVATAAVAPPAAPQARAATATVAAAPGTARQPAAARQPAGETPPPRSRPAAARPGGQASRLPPAWRLLGLIRGLRSSERATLADFVHDGPIQELAAAALALHLTAREHGELAQTVGELQAEIDTAGRALRYLTDGDWPFLPPGASLPDIIRQRTAWLPLSSVTVDIRHTCAALRAEAPLIADVVELALFVMTSDGPPSQAHVCVQAGEDDAEIVLTLTQPSDVRDWAADQAQLAELASILGATAHNERGPARWQVRITMPRQCAVGDRRH
jgi:CheY-like chemotaxis protein